MKKQEPDIWLQTYEPSGKMDCGCILISNHEGSEDPAFFFCKLHSMAKDMLGMLRDNLSAWEGEEDSVKSEHAGLIKRLKAVIAKAESSR